MPKYKLTWPAHPQLNVTAPFLDKEGISMRENDQNKLITAPPPIGTIFIKNLIERKRDPNLYADLVCSCGGTVSFTATDFFCANCGARAPNSILDEP